MKLQSLFTRTLPLIIAAATVPWRAQSADAPNTLSAQEKKDGWILLFDGQTTKGWRNFKKDSVGPGWQVIDGALTRAKGGAGDIITQDQFDAYELLIEYRIGKAGNSGIMFHVTEESNQPYETGPEIQVQDNVDGHDPQKSGWLYQFYKSDVDATKPVGQWNEIRFLLTPEKGALWMNGKLYYEFVQGSDDWNQRLAKSKFAGMPKFGKAAKGYICLQDHGNEVAFRNIKIRKIGSK